MSPPPELLPAACVHVFTNLGHHILVMPAEFTFSLFRVPSPQGSDKFGMMIDKLLEIGLHMQGQGAHLILDGIEEFLEPLVAAGVIYDGMKFKVQL